MATLDKSRAKMFGASMTPSLAIGSGNPKTKNSLSVQAGGVWIEQL
jgi:hypothetical protein